MEGVSDKDYIAHVIKHASMQQQQQQQKKSNGQVVAGSGAGGGTAASGSSWNVYSAAQNLPAVLNDPNKGKQSNFLTKTWGDSFIEKVEIPKCPYLPEITMQHLESYLRKIARVGCSFVLEFENLWGGYDLWFMRMICFFCRDIESTHV